MISVLASSVADRELNARSSQLLATGRWFSPGIPVSSTNKTDRNDITQLLLEVALNTINQQTNLYLYIIIYSLLLYTRIKSIRCVLNSCCMLFCSFI